MDLGLKGKVAMVAAASRGLGYAVARGLAVEGAMVSIASRDASRIEIAAGRLAEETRTDVLACAVDLRSWSDIQRWHAQTVARYGGIDLLFVNVGGPPHGATLSFDDDAWQAAFETLVLGAVRVVRVAVPSMRLRGGGAIVISTSTAIREPVLGLALSSILRSSVGALAKALSSELAPERIRVNHLLPGRIYTDRLRELEAIRSTQSGVSVVEQRARQIGQIPLQRYGEPGEFAAAAVFLLSGAASYITGSSLQVDGGLLRSVV